MIREGVIEDAERAVSLLALVTPEFVMSVDGFRHVWTSAPPEARRRCWCAESDGEIVGWASATLVLETSEPGVAWVAVAVHPDHRGGGLGRALLDRVEPHLAEVGAHRALGWSRDDEATVRFVEASGFERTSASTISVVDPRDVAPPEPPEGVELVPFSSFAGDPAAVHHVDAVSFRDEPGDVTFDNLPYEDWLERHWAHPGIDRDASAVALVDGVPAAITYLQTDRSTGRATNTGTGTLPEHRGRGLATLVKRASLTCAATLGIRAVYTGNDESNAAMLAVNGKLGYRPCSTMLNWVRVLDAEGPNPAGSARR